jgi:hypothetical protein
MLSNKNYENQSSLLLDSITSNTNATFNNSSFTGVLTLPSGQIVTASKELVDLNSAQTLSNKTLSQISNVDNTSDLSKPVSTATQTALNLKADQTSISNINNTSDLSKPISTATQTALNLKADQTSISNIDNTSDLLKPISTATQEALDLKTDILPTSFYSPTSTQLGYIMNATTSTINKVLTTSTPAQLLTLTLPTYGVWLVSGQIEYFCYSNTSLNYSQISQLISPPSVFTNNNTYTGNLLSGTITTNNSIIQQIQGIFNINETPTGSNNVLNLISNVTFSAGNVLVKCVDSTTTATTTSAITASSTVVITLANAGIVVGMKVTGTGITATPPIVILKSGTTITMSTAQTLSASTVLTFTNTAGNTYLNAVRIG